MPTSTATCWACQLNRATLRRVTDDDTRWIPAWMAFVRTHTRFWDAVEAAMRREHGLSMARYDVLANLDNAGGRLGLGELAAAIALSPSGLSKLFDRMEAS